MTPVERIARAMASHARVDPDIGWRIYVGHAQAALTAILTPSESMVEAGWRAKENGMTLEQMSRAVWQAMVQAAMQEGRG